MVGVLRIIMVCKAEAMMGIEPTDLCVKPLLTSANIDVGSKGLLCAHDVFPPWSRRSKARRTMGRASPCPFCDRADYCVFARRDNDTI